MFITIRPYQKADCPAIASLIQRCLMEVNALYYPPSVITFMINHYTAEQIGFYAEMSCCLIACSESGKIVGTISLGDECMVYTTFVDPSYQRQKIGSRLLDHLIKMAKSIAVSTLYLQSSINAEIFYREQGFIRTGEQIDNDFGHTITMERVLAS